MAQMLDQGRIAGGETERKLHRRVAKVCLCVNGKIEAWGWGNKHLFHTFNTRLLFSLFNTHAFMQFFALACKQNVARGCVNLGVMKYEGTQISKDQTGTIQSSTTCLKDPFMRSKRSCTCIMPSLSENTRAQTGSEIAYVHSKSFAHHAQSRCLCEPSVNVSKRWCILASATSWLKCNVQHHHVRNLNATHTASNVVLREA